MDGRRIDLLELMELAGQRWDHSELDVERGHR
jgi:hypothetical protein